MISLKVQYSTFVFVLVFILYFSVFIFIFVFMIVFVFVFVFILRWSCIQADVSKCNQMMEIWGIVMELCGSECNRHYDWHPTAYPTLYSLVWMEQIRVRSRNHKFQWDFPIRKIHQISFPHSQTSIICIGVCWTQKLCATCMIYSTYGWFCP